jgi:hypothetical protein
MTAVAPVAPLAVAVQAKGFALVRVPEVRVDILMAGRTAQHKEKSP